MIYFCGEDIGIMEEGSRVDVPSLRSVKGLVGRLLEVYEDARVGDIVERNLNDESKDWDIRVSHRVDLLLVRELTSCDKRNALGLLNARADQDSHSKVFRVQICQVFHIRIDDLG